MNNSEEALENCLQALSQGADLETCLRRFPAQAEELRPLLQAAQKARSAAPLIPVGAQRRGRARLLQAAAEMREQRFRRSFPFIWKALTPTRSLRLVFAALSMFLFLLTGGTTLVSASSGALPGDNLYPVKRSWENLRLWTVFNPDTREKLLHEYEQERVDEVHRLFEEKRMEHVYFNTTVESINGSIWVVDGIAIRTDEKTSIDESIQVGDLVWIKGDTEDEIIEADEIRLLQSAATHNQNTAPQPRPQQNYAPQSSSPTNSPTFTSTTIAATPSATLLPPPAFTHTAQPQEDESDTSAPPTVSKDKGEQKNSHPEEDDTPEASKTPHPEDDD